MLLDEDGADALAFRDQDSLEERPDAAERIACTLNPALKPTISTDCTVHFIPRSIVGKRTSYDNMYKQLVQLSMSPKEIGAFAICRALRLWGHHFSDHCLSKQVISLLHCRGNEQKKWGRSKSSDMDEITSGVSEIKVQGHSEGKTDLEHLHNKIKYAEEQCGIEKSLQDSFLFNLTVSLKICHLVSWLKYQLQLFETDEAKEGRLENFEDEVASLFNTSDKLEEMEKILYINSII